MKNKLKNNYLLGLIMMFCLFGSFENVKAVTVTEATAAQTCTWNWIRNICATKGPTDPYPTFETSGSCPSATSYWHSDKVQNSCTGERRCGNSGIWTGKSYTIPATYNCTYISGADYGACTGNSTVAYKYVTGYNYSTVSGSSCSDVPFGPVACSENASCGTSAKTYLNSETAFSGSWCTNGIAVFPNGVPSFPDPGETTVNWSCMGLGGGTSPTNCHAGRRLVNPSVDLKIDVGNGPSNGPVNPNRDNGDNLDISWTVRPNASGVTTYCSKSGSSWGTLPNPLIPGVKGLIDSDNDIPLPSGVYPINNSSYSLTCHNSNGNPEVNSNSVTDSVLVSVYCNDTPPAYNACSKECGTGWQTCSDKNNRCVESVCPGRNCNTEPCPITSEWKEVRP